MTKQRRGPNRTDQRVPQQSPDALWIAVGENWNPGVVLKRADGSSIPLNGRKEMRQKGDSMWAGPQHRIQHCWVRVSQMLWRCSLHLHSGNLGYSWVSRYLVWACQVKRPCIFLSLGIHLSTLSLHVSASRPVWPWRSKRIWGREWWEFFVNFAGVWSMR